MIGKLTGIVDSIADDVVINDGDTASLAGRVDELHDMYLQLAAAKA